MCGSRFQLALSLLETNIMIRVIGVIAVPWYWYQVGRAQSVSAIAGVPRAISKCMHDNPRVALNGLGKANGVAGKGKGSFLKDVKRHSARSDCDLDRVGIGGRGKVAFTNKESREGVIRAREGKDIGLAGAFDP